jgi:hypothetical protein
MPASDAGVGGPAAWFERAAVPGRSDTAASGGGVLSRDEELTAVAFRAQQIGIPAWRVMVALGVPQPPGGVYREFVRKPG